MDRQRRERYDWRKRLGGEEENEGKRLIDPLCSHVEVCKICEDYSHPKYDCPYYPKYENYHYSSHASPQPNFFGLMPSPQIPHHEKRSVQDMTNDLIFRELHFQQNHQQCQEENQQFQQSTSLEDMMKQLLDDQQQFHKELQQFSLHNQFLTQKENVSVDTLKNVEVNEVTQVEDYWSETAEGLEVFQIEPYIIIAQEENEENEMKIEVISERSEEPQKERKKDQPLVLVKPPTLPCIFVKPYKGVEVKERSRIFYTTDTFVLDDHDATYSFVLKVPNELQYLKEGMPISLPNM
ncbi:hypothetical protein Scep_030347 [Stephania cephalantha]|uniref:Uncharacterized protein n=1 Tax=Stephania cephalantha TaxID=152367 RepID=A0AAP0DZK4_9MAGN